ncbi:LegC family aminotransferase [Clostridium sp. LY3-2]|uniref:LegC family aminotransferase n=1 Tax=Clostridium sp. LY3-2 TaxID=2942482 RepID=UPI002152D2F4|nr:LegC family aminotransferase [Clostridium sp. LY3-2]MCR6513573.1 LegC family aminotransferase [Clostridium sp. LY3-2]
MNFIPLSVPNLKGNEKKYVLDAIEKEWVSTGGEYINKFEENIAKYVDVPLAVSCQSGTSGIHLSLIEAGVKSGCEVIVPTLTFIAAVNPVKYLNAEPIFMDCDDSLTLDPIKLKEFLENECVFDGDTLINKHSNREIKAIVVVHIFGNLANMEKIMELSKKYNLKVIEDATEALGSKFTFGKYKGKHSGTIGDFGIYSFNGNKIITTGGGGMIVSNDLEKLNHIKYLSTQAKDDTLHYVHNEIGYNYRMTNVQAAIGLAQLEELDSLIKTKKENFFKYKKEIEKMDKLSLIEFSKDIEPNYWFYGLNVEKSKYDVDTWIKLLHENNIQTRPIWGLIHEQLPYRDNYSYKIEKAKYYVKNIINIPCSSNLKSEEVDYVLEKLNQIEEN